MGALDGLVIAITGAARGMGREHALLAAELGARVVLADPGVEPDGTGGDASLVEQVAQEIRAKGGEAVGLAIDVASTEGAQELLDTAISTFGRADGLVNNAGILRDRMLVNLTDDDWDLVIRGQLRATFAPCRAFARHWRERHKAGESPQAAIVNVSSTSGLIGAVGQSNYGAAKAGIAALTVILAAEAGRFGVRVNAVTPVARTRMTENLPKIGELMAVPTEPGRFDTYHPGNVSPLVCWLLSRDCPVTGQVYYAKGGEVRQMIGWSYGWTFDLGRRLTVEEVGAQILSRTADTASPAAGTAAPTTVHE